MVFKKIQHLFLKFITFVFITSFTIIPVGAIEINPDDGDARNCSAIFYGSDSFQKVFGSFNLGFLKTCASYYKPLTIVQLVFGIITLLPILLLLVSVFNILKGAIKIIRSSGNEHDLASGKKTVTNAVVGILIVFVYFMFIVNIFSVILFGEPYLVILTKIGNLLQDGVLAPI